MLNYFSFSLPFLLASPAWLGVIALGLYLSQQAQSKDNITIGVLWFGLVFGLWQSHLLNLPEEQILFALYPLTGIVGLLVALAYRPPVGVIILLAALMGALLGLLHLPSFIPGIPAIYPIAAQVIVSVLLLLALFASTWIFRGLNSLLDGLILRMLGAWLSAISIMILAFSWLGT